MEVREGAQMDGFATQYQEWWLVPDLFWKKDKIAVNIFYWAGRFDPFINGLFNHPSRGREQAEAIMEKLLKV